MLMSAVFVKSCLVYTLRLLNLYFQHFQTVFIKQKYKVIFDKLSLVKISYLHFLEFQLIFIHLPCI